jgi:hypothetical protein
MRYLHFCTHEAGIEIYGREVLPRLGARFGI